MVIKNNFKKFYLFPSSIFDFPFSIVNLGEDNGRMET